MEGSWYKEWFNEDYLLLYDHRDNKDAEKQIDLIDKTISLKNKKIVDACCGNGRHTKILTERGFDACGFDLSKTLINMGKKEHPQLHIWVQNALTIGEKKEKYDVVLSLFTSFGYLENKKKDMEILKSYGQILNPKGVLWLDYFNSAAIKKKLNQPTLEWKKKEINKKIFFWQVQLQQNKVIKEIKVQESETKTIKNYREIVNLYTPEELKQMLDLTGFSLKKILGNYDGMPYETSSPRAIFVAEKK